MAGIVAHVNWGAFAQKFLLKYYFNKCHTSVGSKSFEHKLMDFSFNSEAIVDDVPSPLILANEGPDTMETTEQKDLRCGCSRLLARWTPKGYELKCSRCKSLWQLPFQATAKTLLLVSDGAKEK